MTLGRWWYAALGLGLALGMAQGTFAGQPVQGDQNQGDVDQGEIDQGEVQEELNQGDQEPQAEADVEVENWIAGGREIDIDLAEPPDEAGTPLKRMVELLPNRDIDDQNMVGEPDDGPLWRLVDDGPGPGFSDEARSFVHTRRGAERGFHTVGYENERLDRDEEVRRVVVRYRARQANGAEGTVRVELYDGNRRIARGPEHDLSNRLENFSDAFGRLNLDRVNQLRTKIIFRNHEDRGTVGYTQIWLRVRVEDDR
jgi:hypothetical protein